MTEATDLEKRNQPLTPEGMATRDRIVETAERLFRQMGYQKTTVADIARELKMSPANVYRFFQSKQAILEAVSCMLLSEVVATARSIADRDCPASTRLKQFLHEIHAYNRRQFMQERKMHEMVECAIRENWASIHAFIEEQRGELKRILQSGVASGEFDITDLDQTTQAVHGAMTPYFHPMLISCWDEQELSAAMAATEAFLLKALLKPSPTKTAAASPRIRTL
jgi:AcrR family transcriptional regulator